MSPYVYSLKIYLEVVYPLRMMSLQYTISTKEDFFKTTLVKKRKSSQTGFDRISDFEDELLVARSRVR